MINPFTTAGLLGFLCVTPLMAAPFTITGGAATDADGFFNFTLSGDTGSRSAILGYWENEEAANGVDFLSTSFTDPNATYSVSPGLLTMNSIGFRERSAFFTVSDPTFAFEVGSTDGTSEARRGYSFSFEVGEVFNPDNSIAGFDLNRVALIIAPMTTISFGEGAATVSGSPLSLVPLPASAPMFGAALVALGGIGYAAKRKKAAAAA